MKYEAGKKYWLKLDNGEKKEWTVTFVDNEGYGWGPLDGRMLARTRDSLFIEEWKPDPGEGYDLLVAGQPNFEVVEYGDEFYNLHNEEWQRSYRITCPPAQKCFYRRRSVPKYVPYTWEDARQLVYCWYKFNDGKNYAMVVKLENRHGEVLINGITAEDFLANYVWSNDEPCGKKAE